MSLIGNCERLRLKVEVWAQRQSPPLSVENGAAKLVELGLLYDRIRRRRSELDLQRESRIKANEMQARNRKAQAATNLELSLSLVQLAKQERERRLRGSGPSAQAGGPCEAESA